MRISRLRIRNSPFYGTAITAWCCCPGRTKALIFYGRIGDNSKLKRRIGTALLCIHTSTRVSCHEKAEIKTSKDA